MQKRYVLKAPAKLNLHLQVGKKRQDGFHDINSLFVMVDLYDQISLCSLKTGNDCRIVGNFNCSTEENLIYKAWKNFCKASGRVFGAEFNVEKKIPSFAGLGGGSSDAAAALRLLNMMSGNILDDKAIIEAAAVTGSDVPFFISTAAALIEGRGERIRTIENARIMDFVIVHPSIEISTPDAYRWLDEEYENRRPFIRVPEMERIYKGELSGFKNFFNDFSTVLRSKYKVFDDIFTELNSAGALYTGITGSGSAVFGLFDSTESAEKAEKMLQNEYYFVRRIKSLDRIPYAILEY